jgi:hypothetical protein
MVKIYKDFFDPDCLKYIEDSIEKSKNGANLRTSYPTNAWQPDIIQESTPVMIYDLHDADILLKPLKEVIDIEGKVNFAIYYWPVGSYISWHNDGHASFTATVYCNRYWDRDWGGLFLYEEQDKIFAEVPEWNKLVVQTDKDWHSTTSITKPYYRPVATANGHDMIPNIRTTLQIFQLHNV